MIASLSGEYSNMSLLLKPEGMDTGKKQKSKRKDSGGGTTCYTSMKALMMWSTDWMPQTWINKLDQLG